MHRFELRLPSLGESVTEATIVRWLVEPGAAVAAGQPVVEIASDKADMTLEAPAAGWLLERSGAPGDVVATGAVLMVFSDVAPGAASAYRRAASPDPRQGGPPAAGEAGAATRRVSSGAPWEAHVGYCRALRRGPLVVVSGTAPLEPTGGTHAVGDPYRQARRCLALIEAALGELGVGLHEVVRTRMFVTDITMWAQFGRAHAEVFGGHPPATSMVEVRRLIAPDMLIEIEAEAWSP